MTGPRGPTGSPLAFPLWADATPTTLCSGSAAGPAAARLTAPATGLSHSAGPGLAPGNGKSPPGLRLGRRVAQGDRARQQVRAAYRRVLAAAARRGGRRQAGTTPRRYQEELLAQHAQLARWLPGLTAAYVESRYSRHRLAPDAVARVRRGARRIVRFLQPPRQRRTARGSATTPPRDGR